jgi:hypothetical protein
MVSMSWREEAEPLEGRWVCEMEAGVVAAAAAAAASLLWRLKVGREGVG